MVVQINSIAQHSVVSTAAYSVVESVHAGYIVAPLTAGRRTAAPVAVLAPQGIRVGWRITESETTLAEAADCAAK